MTKSTVSLALLQLILFSLLLLICTEVHGSLYASHNGDHSVQKRLQEWMCASKDTCVKNFEEEPIPRLIHKFIKRLEDVWSENNETGSNNTSFSESQYSYFAFLPKYMGSVIPDGVTVNFSTKCFERVSVTARHLTTEKMEIIVIPSEAKSLLCVDLFLLEGGGGYLLKEIAILKPHRYTMDVSLATKNKAEEWYLLTKGIRIHLFPGTYLDMMGKIIKTLNLFKGHFTPSIPPDALTANMEFMRDYVQSSSRMSPPVGPRTSGSLVARSLNTTLISSGDVLMILRADGLNPMIGWAEGSTVGHTAVAMRDKGNHQLFICESTTSGAHWPINGVQCNTWEKWLQLVERAGHNVLWMPLAPKYRSKFNTTAAESFLREYVGVDYGYTTFLFGWLDTVRDNLPCLPPYFNTACLTPEMVETVLVWMDRVMGTNRHNIVRQAFTHRVGRWPDSLSVVESLFTAAEEGGKNVSFADIYQIPEQDEWLYTTTRGSGPTQTETVVEVVSKSMVCCVLVCNVWKAAGLFDAIGNKLQCGEQTLWDIYSMKVFDKDAMYAGRPDVCKKYDPENAFCQLTGNLSLFLQPDVNTRELYPHMGERCSSSAPDYVRDKKC
ncbi:uncharacterized protein TM35_000152700 [Trypanosoma theileri]|uniref:Uncharacterized protein n=1 Tax=Trypanosoma theileri TaxID=67003 RepID=A0A1X0NX97_9TRYP|nr:uncharacterized protein TM35_000152700 [Trypanosoma theileri]ORC88839.1 hypothetical protein TM35_000152700 [Trypanosoma theileri]